MSSRSRKGMGIGGPGHAEREAPAEDEEHTGPPELEHVPDDGPMHPAQVAALYEEEYSTETGRKSGAGKCRPELSDDDNDPPVPPSYITHDGVVAKKSASSQNGRRDFQRRAAGGGAYISPTATQVVDQNQNSMRVTSTSIATSRTSSPTNPNIANLGSSRIMRPPPPPDSDPDPNREFSDSNPPMYHHVEATAVHGVEATLIRPEPSLPTVHAIPMEPRRPWCWRKRPFDDLFGQWAWGI